MNYTEEELTKIEEMFTEFLARKKVLFTFYQEFQKQKDVWFPLNEPVFMPVPFDFRTYVHRCCQLRNAEDLVVRIFNWSEATHIEMRNLSVLHEEWASLYRRKTKIHTK